MYSNCSPAWPRFEGWPSIPEQVCITSTNFASLGSSMKSTLSRFVKPGSAGSVHDAWKKEVECEKSAQDVNTHSSHNRATTESVANKVSSHSSLCVYPTNKLFAFYPNQWFSQLFHFAGTRQRSPQCEHLLDNIKFSFQHSSLSQRSAKKWKVLHLASVQSDENHPNLLRARSPWSQWHWRCCDRHPWPMRPISDNCCH